MDKTRGGELFAPLKVGHHRPSAHPGDTYRLNFKRNVAQNLAGIELDEMSDSEQVDKVNGAEADSLKQTEFGIGKSQDKQNNLAGQDSLNPGSPGQLEPPAQDPADNPPDVVATQDRALLLKSFVRYVSIYAFLGGIFSIGLSITRLTGLNLTRSVATSLLLPVLVDNGYKVWLIWEVWSDETANTKRKLLIIGLMKGIILGVFVVIDCITRWL